MNKLFDLYVKIQLFVLKKLQLTSALILLITTAEFVQKQKTNKNKKKINNLKLYNVVLMQAQHKSVETKLQHIALNTQRERKNCLSHFL